MLTLCLLILIANAIPLKAQEEVFTLRTNNFGGELNANNYITFNYTRFFLEDEIEAIVLKDIQSSNDVTLSYEIIILNRAVDLEFGEDVEALVASGDDIQVCNLSGGSITEQDIATMLGWTSCPITEGNYPIARRNNIRVAATDARLKERISASRVQFLNIEIITDEDRTDEITGIERHITYSISLTQD